jgi:mono/diheme cytochrome c family protein
VRRVTLAVCAGLGAAALLAAAAQVRAAGEQSFRLKDGPGRDLTQGRCAVCHSLDYIPGNAPALDRAGWHKEIQKMRERFGAPLTDAEAQQILDYLAANYADKS